MTNRIRQKWKEGQPAIVAWLQIPSAFSAELIAAAGFDGVVVDLQHSVIDFSQAVEMLTAIEARGCEPIVRPSENRFTEIGKLLDAGASGIIAPLVDDAGGAGALSDAIHYPPTGARSLGPRRPLLRWGADYRNRTTELIVSLAMIETRPGWTISMRSRRPDARRRVHRAVGPRARARMRAGRRPDRRARARSNRSCRRLCSRGRQARRNLLRQRRGCARPCGARLRPGVVGTDAQMLGSAARSAFEVSGR
jgi:4-hydroxy-2-oxoheptanedioate aldolase